LNLAGVRPTVLNILKRDKAKLSLARNRLKDSVNPTFRAALLAYLQFRIPPWPFSPLILPGEVGETICKLAIAPARLAESRRRDAG
jgi:hypothetical protein